MGLLSWYCGLSAVSVKENDILKKGDTIGRAGSSSIFCENGVNILTSVGGVLINPDGLVSD
jgi:septal ring factor EnvC (AmiA/AmiB activator)